MQVIWSLLLTFILPFVSDQFGSMEMTLNQARETLKMTSPNRYYFQADSVIKSAENLHKRGIFDRQWAAILCFAAQPTSTNVEDVDLLVPYLDYGITGEAFFPVRGRTSLPRLEQIYPVFGVVLHNPDASSALSFYCLDSKNGLRDRINAFVVLRYVNRRVFNSVKPTFEAQLSMCSELAKRYLMGVENNQISFQGNIPIADEALLQSK